MFLLNLFRECQVINTFINMPIFGSKFSPKKTPPRRSLASLNSNEPLDELVSENRSVRLRLSGQDTYFENGNWVSGNLCFYMFEVLL